MDETKINMILRQINNLDKEFKIIEPKEITEEVVD